MVDRDRVALAAEAYVYGFPLVFDIEQMLRYVQEGVGVQPAAPFNRFSHGTQLPGARDRFVSINNDTIYSLAQVDLGAGPQLLHLPEIGERYAVFQFVDAWTNNFAYLGTRATGTAAATYLLTPPGWEGTAPDGVRQIAFPTRVATIVGRLACDGEQDLPAIAALQAQLSLEPLAGGERYGEGVPDPAEEVPDALVLFERMRVWMAAFPPPPADVAYQQRFAPLGLLEATSPYVAAPESLTRTLTEGVAEGRQRLEQALRSATHPKVNGWATALHAFDYNVSFFEIGTVNAPEWRIDDPATARVARAIAARGGLWGNHGYEAAYFFVYEDDAGEQLDGRRRYTLRFEQSPPCRAFWSVTMYDLPDYYMVENPIDRYSIGDRTGGLRYAADGSLTIVIQHEPPDDQRNWLPAPAGEFRPILRMYLPEQSVLDGTYRLPPVERVG